MARKQPGSTQPYGDHDVMSQAEQARFLGAKPERTKNLGHDTTVDKLTENPARMMNYDSADTSRIISEPRSQGVYGRFRDPKDGTSTSENLSRWSDYARSNSYSVDGRGRDPKGRGAGSDNHLAPLPKASTETWDDFRAGSESGEGRLEKLHRK